MTSHSQQLRRAFRFEPYNSNFSRVWYGESGQVVAKDKSPSISPSASSPLVDSAEALSSLSLSASSSLGGGAGAALIAKYGGGRRSHYSSAAPSASSPKVERDDRVSAAATASHSSKKHDKSESDGSSVSSSLETDSFLSRSSASRSHRGGGGAIAAGAGFSGTRHDASTSVFDNSISAHYGAGSSALLGGSGGPTMSFNEDDDVFLGGDDDVDDAGNNNNNNTADDNDDQGLIITTPNPEPHQRCDAEIFGAGDGDEEDETEPTCMQPQPAHQPVPLQRAPSRTMQHLLTQVPYLYLGTVSAATAATQARAISRTTRVGDGVSAWSCSHFDAAATPHDDAVRDVFVAQLPFDMPLSALQELADLLLAGPEQRVQIIHAAPHLKKNKGSYDGCAFVKMADSHARRFIETFHKRVLFDVDGVWIATAAAEIDELTAYCAWMQTQTPEQRREVLPMPTPFSAMTAEFALRATRSAQQPQQPQLQHHHRMPHHQQQPSFYSPSPLGGHHHYNNNQYGGAAMPPASHHHSSRRASSFYAHHEPAASSPSGLIPPPPMMPSFAQAHQHRHQNQQQHYAPPSYYAQHSQF